jgi:hypothetical protein
VFIIGHFYFRVDAGFACVHRGYHKEIAGSFRFIPGKIIHEAVHDHRFGCLLYVQLKVIVYFLSIAKKIAQTQ